ncbi:hypothetical protein NMG60_11023173 [Bertholletia excelsa]
MDSRLLQACWTGDVEKLQILVRDNPSILISASLEGGESPLHIACKAGHFEFVKEVIKLRRQFAEELNQDGLSPLHIASGTGHKEIVKEILRLDSGLCLIKGRERRIPLHYAAIKGQVDVMRELLSACADSVEEVTIRGETALHLAVKNNQFEVLKILVEQLQQFSKGDVLNKKDNQGNTLLHLAVSKKQYEVVDLGLNKNVIPEGAMEINALNNRGLTALDVLLLFQSEAGDREIEEILRQAGAKKAEELFSSLQELVITNPPQEQSEPVQGQSPTRQLEEYFKYHTDRDSPGEVRNTLLVICTLIATATYQAILSPPGGVWGDDSDTGSENGTNSSQWHQAGRSIMGSKNMVAYVFFLLLNSVGFFASIRMINFLTCGFPLQMELQIAMVALIWTYDICMAAITPNWKWGIVFAVIATLPLAIHILTKAARNHLMKASLGER